ncbi:two-component sensor histidine kinase [Pelagivirga sediminicola]|uniref:histidine kinase n=1 Tax=Pelagivirga sediminicola TaxID=2170575 RepID=A0A2T7G3D1_9RHOB|nr:ATP-binding protein [Pelagivirga sediminicola]PVA08929.1 two-component sensor histidine kinase [Pelagivirga sediminicola]
MPNNDLDAAPSVQDLITAFPLPTLVIGRDEKIERLNAAAGTLLGENLVGRHFTTALRHPALVDAVERCLRDHTPREVSYQVVGGANDAFYDVHLQPVAASALLLLSFQNATDLAHAEKMRRDFVANVSHELRTPLTALMGFIETLRSSARDDAKARDRFLGIMSDEAERMNRLVGKLLSLSRVEADQHVRPTTELDLRVVLRRAQENLAQLARDGRVDVRLDSGQAPLQVIGDADQLLQVFTNLLENAIKYGGNDRTVDIITRKSAHDPVLRGPAMEIVIADQGPGIDPIHLPRLTERFYRVDGHRSRELGGTGLGLAIVKHILNRHRGRLKIASQPGKGAQFIVVLPLDA